MPTTPVARPSRLRPALAIAIVVALVVAAAIGVGLTRWHASGGSNTAAAAHRAAQDKPGPVVLIPGYGGDASALDALADRLRRDGKQATVLDLPDGGTGDLQVQADALARTVDTLITGGAPSVDLVGYSAGGVVARLYLADHPDAGTVRRVVSLGSPFHGTQLAGLAASFAPSLCGVACHQLEPDSSLLDRIDGLTLTASGVAWLSLWSTSDEVVTPPDSSSLAGAVNVPLQTVCADSSVAHNALPTDPLVVGLVLTSLGKGALPHPGPTYCDSLRSRGI